MIYADIIVDISHENIDRVFQYAVPSELQEKALVGVRVNIPFGQGNRRIKGYIVGLSDKASYDPQKIKYIDSISDNSVAIENHMIRLACYIKDTFGGTMNDALKTVLPVKSRIKAKEKKNISLIISNEECRELLNQNIKKNNSARVRFLETLVENDYIDYDFVVNKLNISRNVIKFFEENAIIKVSVTKIYRNPVVPHQKETYCIELNEAQKAIFNDFTKDYLDGIRRTYLIHGVTGSGKTEVYMSMIDTVIAQKKQVIMLIPEIALTYQTVMRFYSKFGDRISILNSRMSQGERYDQYIRAKNNDIDIMIGPRSALFTPFSNIGLIIIDEEHESSYKSESVPKYHAREVAIERARLTNASVVLGSATPSVEAYYKALQGEYKLYKLLDRANKSSMPIVWVEDMREELKAKNKSIFSRKLRTLIEDRLSKKEQVMLFINRRGYSGFVSCRSCGHVMKCPHCDVSLTYHHTKISDNKYYNRGKLVCHYCGFEIPNVEKCPECGSDYIALFGTGTQKIEEMVTKIFPTASVLRMDADTTSGKNGHQDILSSFANGEADILIGTQMIVKGHDFPNVTLMGILAADLSLNTNDYRASERTFQLITQASGRAGRSNKPGEVVIQTYKPDHYSVVTASNTDYENFFNQELLYRKIAKYPPISNILLILAVSSDEHLADELIIEAAKYLQKIEDGCDNFNVIGPTDATLSKANDLFRKVIYIKCKSYSELIELKDKLEAWHKTNDKYKKCSVYYDFNPVIGY